MSSKGAAVVYCVVGGLILYSGIKGASISDTFSSVLKGNLNPTQTEPITALNSASTTTSGASGASAGSVVSGSANQNYLIIANYLVGQGYSKAAAAGICACIAGESGGNPESVGSGGNGLIGWTPPKSGIVTGNASKDLQAQLPLIVQYNNAQGSGLISMLNAQTDPVQAADFYSQHFERPKITDSDVRASVATSVYNSIQSSPVPTG